VTVSTNKHRFQRVIHSRWLPWTILGLVLLATLFAAALGEIVRPAWIAALPGIGQAAAWAAALAGLGLAFLALNRLNAQIEQRERSEQRLEQALRQVDEAYRRMETLFHVSQKFVEASDENQVIEPVLRLMVELTGAQGAAFVPLDEHGQPQTALSFGELPFSINESWLDYLSSAEVRERCRDCEAREPLERPADCPVLKGPFENGAGLACLPVRRGEREFGVMNLVLPQPGALGERTRAFVGALLDEAALGLEGVYLRRRELSVLRQMQTLRQKTDLTALLNSLLENVYNILEADFAVMLVPGNGGHMARVDLSMGNFPPQARPFVNGLLQGVLASGEPVLLGDLAGDPAGDPRSRPELKSLLAAPLLSPERVVLGAILVGNRRKSGFQHRHLPLLQTIAGQVALVVQNASLMAELEYQTMLRERARLAREIHDGLAQTIGFLKLQAAQLRNQLEHGDAARARQSADLFYATLSEAYQDARQAIDGLRVSPDECGLAGWLHQIADEFQELSGLPVHIDDTPVEARLSPEVQAQLIRIIQEALSNVRKHANAGEVWLALAQTNNDLVLEVRDDGDGFTPQDITSASRHGLRSMRERAELIGADFQVVSLPGRGATVRVRLPVDRSAEMTG
jgi:two-component system nitrate/nitrite sensor histidine kinase NarX